MGYIEYMLDRYPGHTPIILGDFNFEYQTSHKGSNVFSTLSTERHMVACDDLDINNVGYTYIHESLNQRSLIDHVFMSCDMKSSVNSYAVLSDGTNLSDHLPVEFKMCLSLFRIPSKADRRTVLEYRWDKGDVNS